VRTVHALLLALIAWATSCYHLPIWHGEIVVHPLDRASVEACGTGALTTLGQQRLTREPYLQSTTTRGTIVAFGLAGGHAEVILREPGKDGEIVRDTPALPANEHASGDIRVLDASFDGLEAGHLYCYQIVDAGAPLTEPAPLATAAGPALDEPFSFVAVGDTGTGGDAERAIAQRMTEYPFDLIVFLGDIAYSDGTDKQLQDNFFAVYKNILRYVPAYPTLGNHERHTRKGQPYFDAFVLPSPERYYSFDWGDVHFVAIDTTHRDTEQVVWLQHDLAKTKQRWKIVFGHHPPYTNSLRGPQMWIRRAYAKIFTDNKVDLVLSGHEHQYERFRVAGVNYVISGGGGGQLMRFFGSTKSLAKATVHHFLHFDVTANTLVMKAIDIDGKLIEEMKLEKPRDNARPEVKVNDKPEKQETPVAPEQTTVPDEKLHDEPDDDVNEPKQPPVKREDAPRVPTPPAVQPDAGV
jgi:hypothetical protein